MNLHNNEEILSNVVTAKEGLPVKAIAYDLLDVVPDNLGKTAIKVEFGIDCLSIQPDGMGTADGDFPPIMIERAEGKIRLIYFPDVNSDIPVIVDMSGALESARRES